MNRSRAIMVLVASLSPGCGDTAPPATPAIPAASVANPVTEASLTTVTLSAEAEQRLGLETATIQTRVLPDTRQLSGVVMTPPGRSFLLTAPVAGTIMAPAGAGIPAPGASVARQQPLLRLVPLPPATELARGDEELALAEVRAHQAELEATRIEALARDSLVSRRELERAQGERDAARTVLAAARMRLERQRTGDTPGLSALTLPSPDQGIVVELHTGAGQMVAAGAPLMLVARMDPLWVKVAVFSGDLSRIAPGGQATVSGDPPRGARRVQAPPTADPLSASADVFYQLARLAAPLGALVYDQSGGSWVYVKTGERSYARRRVAIQGFADGWAILSLGPPAGTPVVTHGAAELLGTEFGAGK
jgi:hypothetical protein